MSTNAETTNSRAFRMARPPLCGRPDRSTRRSGALRPNGVRRAGLLLHGGDEDVRHLGARELDRRALARAEHLAHLRARERHPRLLAVRAGLRAGHALTRVAPE